MDYKFVGLDMSLTGTGFVIKDKGKAQPSTIRTIKTVPKNFKNDLERYQFIVNEVMQSMPEASFIIIEDVFSPQSKAQIGAAMKLIGLAYLTRTRLYNAGHPFFIAAPNQVKKFVSGNGQCPKDQVTKEVFKRWNVDTKDDNQADAVVMAYLAEAIHNYVANGSLDGLTKPQAEVVKAITHERPSYNVEVKKTVSDKEDEE